MVMAQTNQHPLAGRHFLKMNGLGNDFVILDGRTQPVAVDAAAARAIADRARGIGFDQLIVLEPSARADLFMRILNADGSEAGACGNATRCIGRLVMDETGRGDAVVETTAGLLSASDAGAWDRVTVDMGAPRLGWAEIPLARPCADTRAVPFDGSAFAPLLPRHFSAVSMGNPHAIFFVEDIAAQELGRIGPLIEHHPLFPERVNVSLAHVTAHDALTLAVWERGAGLTRACGTGACAAAVASHRAGLTGRKVAVTLPGGTLDIHWQDAGSGTGPVLMTGAVALDFEGALPAALFDAGAAPLALRRLRKRSISAAGSTRMKAQACCGWQTRPATTPAP
jgi:diaminopimelate epimerase